MEESIVTADSLKQQGNAAFASLQFKKAAKIYRDAIKLDGANPVLFANRAQCFLKLADYTRANCDCNDGLALNPSTPLRIKLVFRKGLALKGLQDHAQARNCFQQVLSLDPGNTAAATEIQSLKLRRLDSDKLRTVHIEVQVIDKVPAEYFEGSTASTGKGSPTETIVHVASSASESPPNTSTESKPANANSPESTPFGERLSMSMLAALKNIPESQKHAAYRYVLAISVDDLTALFGPGTAGVEPEFLEFFMQAAAYASSGGSPEDWVDTVYNSLSLLSTFPRFGLNLALCDRQPILTLESNVFQKFPDYVERYKAIWN